MPRPKRLKTTVDMFIGEGLHMSVYTPRQEKILQQWNRQRRYRQDVFFLVGETLRYAIEVAEDSWRKRYGVSPQTPVPGIDTMHHILTTLLELAEVEVETRDDKDKFEQLDIFDFEVTEDA